MPDGRSTTQASAPPIGEVLQPVVEASSRKDPPTPHQVSDPFALVRSSDPRQKCLPIDVAPEAWPLLPAMTRCSSPPLAPSPPTRWRSARAVTAPRMSGHAQLLVDAREAVASTLLLIDALDCIDEPSLLGCAVPPAPAVAAVRRTLCEPPPAAGTIMHRSAEPGVAQSSEITWRQLLFGKPFCCRLRCGQPEHLSLPTDVRSVVRQARSRVPPVRTGRRPPAAAAP